MITTHEIGRGHILSLWINYGLSKINISQLINGLREVRHLKEISMDINYECNFSCTYCSYGFKKLHGKELSSNEWESIIDDCIDSGVKLFALAGKEPLINDKFNEILLYLNRAREIWNKELIIGLVTNGWFLKEKVDQLINSGLSYLDVSIDGHVDVHDVNRKRGSYNRAIEGLLLAQKKSVAGKCFVSSVLHAQNYKDIPQFIRNLYSEGIKNFSISLIYPTPNVSQNLLFSKYELEIFLNDILPETISKIRDASDLEIVIDIFTASLPFLREMVLEKLINLDKIHIDDIDSLFNYEVLSNGCILYKRFSLDHLTYGKALKITADGYCMYNYESLTKPDYWNYSLGNVRNESISVLHKKLFEDNTYIFKLTEQTDRKICTEEPCYPFCLGKNNNCSFRRYIR